MTLSIERNERRASVSFGSDLSRSGGVHPAFNIDPLADPSYPIYPSQLLA
jgi:hypothetical protein